MKWLFNGKRGKTFMMKKYISDMLHRKDLMIYLILSGLKTKHRNTWLGYFWWLLDPLLNMIVYYFLMVIVLDRGGPDFPVFLAIGVVVFKWFRSSISGNAKSISNKAGIITQVYLPKALFPIGDNITQMINFLFGMVIVVIFLVIYRVPPSVYVVWLPFIMAVQLMFHMAIGFFTAYISVFVRDIEQVLGHITRILRYASPVIWEAGRLPAEYDWLVYGNPFSQILMAYRDVLMYNTMPNILALAGILLVSAVFCVYMIYFYSRNEHKIIKAL
jgi:ABC-type polysaccharide/polyol phosphate export permease